MDILFKYKYKESNGSYLSWICLVSDRELFFDL